MKGLLFDIKRFAIHDGPGIRTTLFFKGCPMKCPWCQNPESRCFGNSTYIHVDKLEEKTFSKTKNIAGWMTVKEVISEIEKERVFFEESGGGVTFSGGEPFSQFEFLSDLLCECRKRNFHTALDTTGYVKTENLKKIYNKIDLFLYDLKLINKRYHKKYTGVSNKIIIDNLKWLIEKNKEVRIRFPLVPGYNDSEKNIDDMKSFLGEFHPKIKHIDLLPYHKLAEAKANRFGLEEQLTDIAEPDPVKIESVKKKFEEIGFIVKTGG